MGQKRKLNCASNPPARKKRNILKNNVNSTSPTFETLFLRFPHLSEAVLEELDNPSLASCREWNKMWNKNLENSKILWLRMIQTLTKQFDGFKKEWIQVLLKIPLEILKKLANMVRDFFKRNVETFQYSPLHLTAQYGDLSLFQYILTRMELKNPKNNKGMTPLHIAAQFCRPDITRCILKELKDKIPKDSGGMTPHHYAASKGDLINFKVLFEHFSDKNQDSNGYTSLYVAAEYGKLNICNFIIKNTLQNTLKTTDNEYTPLHIAAQKGHLEVCKLLFKNMEEKNPLNSNGKTPLQLASENNRWKVAHYLIIANKLHI